MRWWRRLLGYQKAAPAVNQEAAEKKNPMSDEQRAEVRKLYDELMTIPFQAGEWGRGMQRDVRVLRIGLEMAMLVERQDESATELIGFVSDCASRLKNVDRDSVLRALRALDGYGMEYTDRRAARAVRSLMRAATQCGDQDLEAKCCGVLAQLGG